MPYPQNSPIVGFNHQGEVVPSTQGNIGSLEQQHLKGVCYYVCQIIDVSGGLSMKFAKDLSTWYVY